MLHGTAAIGRPKLESARARIADLNPNVNVETHDTRLTSENALGILGAYDVIVDGTDNFADALSRERRVRAARQAERVRLHLPFRRTGVGLLHTPTVRAIDACFPTPPPPGSVPSCAEGGVLGVLPGLVGTIQATEALKLILGVGDALIGRLLLVDALGMNFRTVRVRRDPKCPACGTREITR